MSSADEACSSKPPTLSGSSELVCFPESVICISYSITRLIAASEHHALYNYNIYGAKGLYIALIQVETPYWQPSPAVPAPFTTNTAYHDPAYYSSETSAWGLAIHSSSNVYAYGVNLYSFFQNYSQNCLNTYSCQNGILSVDSASTQIFIYNLNTYVPHLAHYVSSPKLISVYR